jgi:hypothetical protein
MPWRNVDSNLYKLDIEDARIDLRARIFRECEAMAAYMASRGFPASETIKDRIGILDVGIGRRAEIPMGALLDLHGALSEIIKPAIPRTVELLHWDAHQNRWWNKLAPVSAIRHLLGATAFFLALFFLAVTILAGNEEAIRAGLFSAGGIGEILSVTLFLGTLAGLGACFSVLYDARKYVVEGTYDPRIGSNYAIRILLGVVSGILLAQIMLDQVMTQESEARAIYGATLLALLGGFASQFVYTVLNKLVDAAGSVFEQERAAEMKARERAIIIESQEKSSREQVLRTVAAVGLAAELEAAETPEKRKTVIERLIRTASGTPAMEGVAQAAGAAGAGLAALDRSAAAVAFGRTVVDLLPPERAQRARAALDTVEAQIRDARVLARVLRSGDLVGEAARIAADRAERKGDGMSYLGRGFVQLTFRENYRKFARALGEPLEDDPDRAADPDIAAEVLALGMSRVGYRHPKLVLKRYGFGDGLDFERAREIVNADTDPSRSGMRQPSVSASVGAPVATTEACRCSSRTRRQHRGWAPRNTLDRGDTWLQRVTGQPRNRLCRGTMTVDLAHAGSGPGPHAV